MRSQRVDEDSDVGDALLEEVAGALGMLLEQPHRVARLDVVREDEHADGRMRGADLLRSDEALIGVVGGILMSTIATSGRVERDARSTSSPVPALPTTSMPASESRLASPSRRSVSSSAITTRMAAPLAA